MRYNLKEILFVIAFSLIGGLLLGMFINFNGNIKEDNIKEYPQIKIYEEICEEDTMARIICSKVEVDEVNITLSWLIEILDCGSYTEDNLGNMDFQCDNYTLEVRQPDVKRNEVGK